MKYLFVHFQMSLIFFAIFSLLCGLVYPMLVTGIAQTFFPVKANGSLIKNDQGDIIGSTLIGQSFTDVKYFWPRPSLTHGFPYNISSPNTAHPSPRSQKLTHNLRLRMQQIKKAHPNKNANVPVDFVTASFSGLDPHISPATALYQVERVARARNLPIVSVKALVKRHIEERQWGFLGEKHVNVLKLNLALDKKFETFLSHG